MLPSLEELRCRITKRGTETPEVIENRLKRAENEMQYSESYDHIIVNDTVEKAADRFLRIIRKERRKSAKQSKKQ